MLRLNTKIALFINTSYYLKKNTIKKIMQKIGTGIYLKKENKIKTIWKRIQQKQNKNMPEKKRQKRKNT